MSMLIPILTKARPGFLGGAGQAVFPHLGGGLESIMEKFNMESYETSETFGGRHGPLTYFEHSSRTFPNSFLFADPTVPQCIAINRRMSWTRTSGDAIIRKRRGCCVQVMASL